MSPLSESAEPSSAHPTPRRQFLWAGVAGLAMCAGAAVAWRNQAAGQAAAAVDPAVQALWALVLETPTGEPAPLQRYQGKPLLINFWATWCPPCVQELPMLNQFFEQHASKGLQMLGLAIDQPSAVRAFLERVPLTFPIVIGGLQGGDINRSLGNQEGKLPFSVLLDSKGQALHRKIGPLTPQDLESWSLVLV